MEEGDREEVGLIGYEKDNPFLLTLKMEEGRQGKGKEIILPVLVCKGCHNKYHRRGLKLQKFIFLYSGG